MTWVAPVGAAAAVLATAVVVAAASSSSRRRPTCRGNRLRSTQRIAPASPRLRVAAAALVVPAAASVVAGPGLALVLVAAVAALPSVARSFEHRRAAERYDAAVPEVLDELARALRSGAGLGQALVEVASAGPAPVRADLTAVVTAARRGSGLVPALEGWAAARPSPAVRLAVAALCLGVETGGAQAAAIDGVATTVRQRRAAAAEARALASQAQASAAVIALAPVVFCGLAAATDPRVGTFLFRSAPGLAVLATGVALDGAGAWWMARLTRLPV